MTHSSNMPSPPEWCLWCRYMWCDCDWFKRRLLSDTVMYWWLGFSMNRASKWFPVEPPTFSLICKEIEAIVRLLLARFKMHVILMEKFQCHIYIDMLTTSSQLWTRIPWKQLLSAILYFSSPKFNFHCAHNHNSCQKSHIKEERRSNENLFQIPLLHSLVSVGTNRTFTGICNLLEIWKRDYFEVRKLKIDCSYSSYCSKVFWILIGEQVSNILSHHKSSLYCSLLWMFLDIPAQLYCWLASHLRIWTHYHHSQYLPNVSPVWKGGRNLGAWKQYLLSLFLLSLAGEPENSTAKCNSPQWIPAKVRTILRINSTFRQP